MSKSTRLTELQKNALLRTLGGRVSEVATNYHGLPPLPTEFPRATLQTLRARGYLAESLFLEG